MIACHVRAILGAAVPDGGFDGLVEGGLPVSIGRIVRVACLAGLLLPGAPGIAGAPSARPTWGAEGSHRLAEPERIAALLDAVERSGAIFVREGAEYSGVEGRRHLERKLRHAGDRVKTAEDFIENIASRSSLTGRPYLVRLPTGEEMEAGVWLHRKLAEIDALR